MKLFIQKITAFVAILFVIIIVLETGLTLVGIPKIPQINIYAKSQKLIPRIDSNTILLLGDSRVEWGLKPLVLDDAIDDPKLNVINLSLPGSNGMDILTYLLQKSIYPKMILIAYTSNYGRYENHQLHEQKYTKWNELYESVRHHVKENSYLLNSKSIEIYLKGKVPEAKGLFYDAYGGVHPTSFKNYEERKEFQMSLYERWNEEFDLGKLLNYHRSLKQYREKFNKKGTKVIGLYMPVCEDLFELERAKIKSHGITSVYNQFYDYSKITYSSRKDAVDSLYFFDGSHLSHDYANEFSEFLAANVIKKHINSSDDFYYLRFKSSDD